MTANAHQSRAEGPQPAEPSSGKDRWNLPLDESKVAFKTDQPCPQCGVAKVLGFLYLSERGTHQHTHYVCLSWPATGERCGWHGWTVPDPENNNGATGA